MAEINKIVKPIKVADKCKICGHHKVKAYGRVICFYCAKKASDAAKIEYDRKIATDLIKNNLYSKSLIDDKHVFDASFSNFRASDNSVEGRLLLQARRIAGEYLQHPKREFNTILLGQPGTGKTHVAMSMIKGVNDNLNPPQKTLFINITKLFDNLQRSFEDPNVLWTKDETIRILKSKNLIVIDDLGTESAMVSANREASQWYQSLLFRIFDSCKRVIVTTNLTQNSLNATYNSKIISRMMHGAKEHTIDFAGSTDKRG